LPVELHVSSCVVHARPERLDHVRRDLAALPGVDVHGTSAIGKIVVTLETTDEQGIVDRLDVMRDLPGVLSTVLVFHRVEPLPSEPEG
jgi:nitrate reductase NapD